MDEQKSDDHRKSVGEWLSLPIQWRIPVYQRHYAWDWDAADDTGPARKFWEIVKEQTKARLNGKNPPPHYLGAVLVDNRTKPDTTGGIILYDVVDGQQRLLTIQIALLALIRAARQYEYQDNSKEALKKYVFYDGKINSSHDNFRVYPTNFDLEDYKTVLSLAYDRCEEESCHDLEWHTSKVLDAWNRLRQYCTLLVRENEKHEARKVIDAIMKTLTEGFDLVRIVLRENDKAQKIFESLNNYAKPLTTFDLIRNDIFYRAAEASPGMDVELFRTDEWQELEDPYWEKPTGGGSSHIEAYIFRMLIAKIRREIKFARNEIFETYKEFSSPNRHSSINEEVKSIIIYTDTYKYLDWQDVDNPVGANVNFGIFRWDKYKDKVFYPVIFLIVSADIAPEEKQRMLNLLESYLIRRDFCEGSTSGYNGFVVRICRALGNMPNYKKLQEELTSADTPSFVFPKNDDVIGYSTRRDFWKSSFKEYVFWKIEEYMGTKEIQVKVIADRILPEKWEKGNPDWKQMVLEEWVNMGGYQNRLEMTDEGGFEIRGSDGSIDIPELMEDLIRRIETCPSLIGNITLMSKKNKPKNSFEKMKELLSNLKINDELVSEPTWGVTKIEERSKKLAAMICEIWPYDIVE